MRKYPANYQARCSQPGCGFVAASGGDLVTHRVQAHGKPRWNRPHPWKAANPNKSSDYPRSPDASREKAG